MRDAAILRTQSLLDTTVTLRTPDTTTSLLDCGSYDEFKLAILTALPGTPACVKKLMERDLRNLNATDVKWLSEPKRIEIQGLAYWLMTGEAEYEGSIEPFQKALLTLWPCGFSSGYMGGQRWVFNFTVALRCL